MGETRHYKGGPPQAAAIHYRERAKMWRESAMSIQTARRSKRSIWKLPRATRVAAHYERRVLLERSLKAAVRETVG